MQMTGKKGMKHEAGAGHQMQGAGAGMGKRMPYRHFGLMLLLSFVAMYVLMYSMVDRFANAIPNLETGWMTALMIAPMAIFELWIMGAMYPDKKLNRILLVAGFALLVLGWFAMRQQWGIGDREFARAMIPHHAGAILMCREAKLQDAELVKLCGDIASSQQREIGQMKAVLARLDRR